VGRGRALCWASRSAASLASRSARRRVIFAASAARASSDFAAISRDGVLILNCSSARRRLRLFPAIPSARPIAPHNRSAVASRLPRSQRQRCGRVPFLLRLLRLFRFAVRPSLPLRHYRLLLLLRLPSLSPHTEPPAHDRAGRLPFRLGASHRRDSDMVKRKYVPQISGVDFQFRNTPYRNHPK